MTRSTHILIQEFVNLQDNLDMVQFIDGLTMREARLLDRAIAQHLCPTEPAYLSLARVKEAAQ